MKADTSVTLPTGAMKSRSAALLCVPLLCSVALAGSPVNFVPMQDALGFKWDVGRTGTVGDGTADCFDGAIFLSVNGSSFVPQSASNLPGGHGYTLTGRSGSVGVSRHIWLDRGRSVLCCLESFVNGGSSSVNVEVKLRSVLGGSAGSIYTSSGKPFGGELAPGDCGLLAVSGSSRPSVFFLLAGARSRTRPRVLVGSRRQFSFSYRLKLKPGGSGCLVHVLGQRRGVSGPSAVDLFKPLCRGNRLIWKDMPRKMRPRVRNFECRIGPGCGPFATEVMSAADEFGVDRAKADTLVVDSGDELVSGKISCSRLSVRTARGAQEIPLEEVAMLVGGANAGGGERLHLRNGEILAGDLKASELVLQTSSGLKLEPRLSRVGAIFTRAGEGDGRAPEGTVAYLSDHLGNRMVLEQGGLPRMSAVSPWGALELSAENLIGLRAVGERGIGHWVTLAGGSRVWVVLRNVEMQFATRRFGGISLRPSDIAAIARGGKDSSEETPAGSAGGDGVPAGPKVWFHLTGGNLLAGELGIGETEVSTSAGRSRLDLRKVVFAARSGEDAAGAARPRLVFELPRKEHISARPCCELIPLRVEGRLWRIPLREVVCFGTEGKRVEKSVGSGGSSVVVPVAAMAGFSGKSRKRASSLVNARFTSPTDQLGFRWDLNSSGRVNDGTNDCFDGGLCLQVGGRNFSASSAKMTPDGSTYVLSGTSRGSLAITRVVRLDTQAGVARYLEVLHNPGNEPVQVSLRISSCLGGNCSSVLTDRGKPAGGELGRRECGVVAVQNSGGRRPSVFFMLAGPGSRLRPAIMVSGNRQLAFTYNLTVPARSKVAIAHAVSQRRLQSQEAKALAGEFKPLRRFQWLSLLPAGVGGRVLNLGAGPGLGFASPSRVLRSLGVSRGASDVLAFGRHTRLKGTATCEGIEVKGAFGSMKIELKDLAALVGPGCAVQRSCAVLRDGRVVTGRLAARGLRFKTRFGPVIEVPSRRLDRLMLRVMPGDGSTPEQAVALLETADGDRLALPADSRLRLPAITPWGPLDVGLDRIKSFGPICDSPGFLVCLRDGTRVQALLEPGELEVGTLGFGRIRIHPSQIHSVLRTSILEGEGGRDGGEGQKSVVDEILEPHAVFAGGNLVVGRVELKNLHLSTPCGPLPVRPPQVRVLEVAKGPAARENVFRARLWGGGEICGRLAETVLPVRVGNNLWRIPVRQLTALHAPTPTISKELRARLLGLVADLGNEDWHRRERASRKLADIGMMAKGVICESLKKARDAETRQRLREVLESLKE